MHMEKEKQTHMQEVSKQYIKTYNNAGSVTTTQDKLWLLSCSEIWNNGYTSGAYGRAITKEGEQYKYYKNINANYKVANTNLVKRNNGSARIWWLRSPRYDSGNHFCVVDTSRLLQS